MSASLPGFVTAHCFKYPTCKHVEVGDDVNRVHAAMEGHYFTKHRQYIETLTRKPWERVIV